MRTHFVEYFNGILKEAEVSVALLHLTGRKTPIVRTRSEIAVVISDIKQRSNDWTKYLKREKERERNENRKREKETRM